MSHNFNFPGSKITLPTIRGVGDANTRTSVQELSDTFSALAEGYTNVSLLGLPVWDEVTLEAPGLPQITLQIAKVDVSSTKHIVTTAIQGLNGTVKEFISTGDYAVTIRVTLIGGGLGTGAPDYYPKEDIMALKAILDFNKQIKVYSTILNKYMGISSLVVENYNITQPEIGMRNIQEVAINCISDDPNVYNSILTPGAPTVFPTNQ